MEMNKMTKKLNNNINVLFIAFSFMMSFVYGVLAIIDGNIYKLLICLSVIPVILLPYIIEKIFRIKINPYIINVYLIFVFFAHILGSIVDLYDKVYFYDKLIHFMSGIVTSFIAVYALILFKKYDQKNYSFNLIFILSFVLLIASNWEFFEFYVDLIFHKDAQRVISSGVYDTMMDMICASLGCLLFNLCYIWENEMNKELVITKFIKSIN
jgi:hypothetical protein